MPGRGVILRVDLTSEKVSKEPIPPELARKYLGGEGINTFLLWEHFLKVDPKSDPLGPDNVLILGLGPLGATGYGAGSKMKWTFKSPAYNMFGDSVSGGFFGAQLRWAGYDHVVITGRAKGPVYLWIEDDSVQIRGAEHLWGKDTEETNEALKKELGDEAQTACIGQAAEEGVSYASIIVSGHRAAGRTGAGAVMASKNLKAMAARGTKGIPVYDPKGFFKALDAFVAAQYRMPEKARNLWKAYGTLVVLAHYQRVGTNPYRNDQYAPLPDAKYKKLSHWWYRDHLASTGLSCSLGCMWACAGGYRLRKEKSLATQIRAPLEGFKPEYLSIASFGGVADISNLVQVAHLNNLCRKYGMDIMEVGASCGLLMELWQRGLIDEKDLEEWTGQPLNLEWGNYPAVEKIIHSIGRQDNRLGQILQGGVYKAAQRIEDLKNCNALAFALYGKGGAPYVEEVRHTPSWALNMAVSSRGADHLKGVGTLDRINRRDLSKLYFGTTEAAEPLSTKLKGASSVVSENQLGITNSLGMCLFLDVWDPITYPLEIFCQALYALTGESLTPQELSVAGERVVNLEKAFNSRLGYRREDDRLCHRWLHEEVKGGPGKGWKAADYLEQLKDEYYDRRGWDRKTSLQTRRKLKELDMGDVAAVLEKEGALA